MSLQSEFFTLSQNEMKGRFSSLGAGVSSLSLDGKDLILTFEHDEDYLSASGFFGKTLGRIAGRIPSPFVLDGKEYEVKNSEDGISLHGGNKDSFSFLPFEGRVEEKKKKKRVIFTRISKDNECSFPGNLTVTITYSFLKSKENIFRITFDAVSDQDTLCSLSNHIYWNFFSEDVNSYVLTFPSHEMGSFMKGTSLVTGVQKIEPCFDFNTKSPLKEKLDQIEEAHPEIGTLDHTFLFDKDQERKIIVENDDIRLEVTTDFEAVNYYVDSSLNEFHFKQSNLNRAPRRALAIEPETFPLLSNLVLPKGKHYHHTITYKIIKKEREIHEIRRNA